MSDNARLAYEGPGPGADAGDAVELPRGRLALRLARAVAVLFLLAWTVFWGLRVFHAVRYQLSLSTGLYGQGLFAWQIFRAVFTASHLAIPWAAGAVPFALVGGWTHLRLRRD